MNDLSGLQISYLTILGYSHKHIQPCGKYVHYWRVRCICGKCFTRKGTHLTSSKYKFQSCGCKQAEATGLRFKSHGLKKLPIYEKWKAMHTRCQSNRLKDKRVYKDRGITVCDEWKDINVFYKDMGSPPKGYQLDRIDNNKGYFKENCRWVTGIENSKNKNNTRYITINGERKCLSDWCQHYQIKLPTVSNRIRTGWTEEKAIITPVTKKINL